MTAQTDYIAYRDGLLTQDNTIEIKKGELKDVTDLFRSASQDLSQVVARLDAIKNMNNLQDMPADLKQAFLRWYNVFNNANTAIVSDQEIQDLLSEF